MRVLATVELGEAEGHPFRGNQWKAGASGGELPPAPGTTPIPRDHIRLYHYTDASAADIREHGLLLNKAKGETYGEPNMVWASAQQPQGGRTFAEFHIAMDDPRFAIGEPMRIRNDSTYAGKFVDDKGNAYNVSPKDYEKNGSNVAFRADIKPDEIVAVHEPWMEHARYFKDNPTAADDAKSGLHDDLLSDPEYGPAIRYAKQELGDVSGHPFHGNQWTGGTGSADAVIAANPRQPGEDSFAWQSRIIKGLPEQQQSDILFKVRETYPSVPFVAAGINQWCAEHGLPEPPSNCNQIPVDQKEADAVAVYFEKTPDQSGDPRVQAAYEDFKNQSAAMWDFMTKPESEGGMGVKVDFTTQVNPYHDAASQAADLRDNHHIYLESGLGGAHEATMTQRQYDEFRAVHDVFGHAGIGSGFDRHGEYQAWLVHASMYAGAGRDAMSTEYHGVNSAAWTGEPGSPGTGKSLLLPPEYSAPPWDRAVAASADLSDSELDDLIDKLGLDTDFARNFDDLPWHPHANDSVDTIHLPAGVATSATPVTGIPWGNGALPPKQRRVVAAAGLLEFTFNPDQTRNEKGEWTSTGGEDRLAPIEGSRGNPLPYESATMKGLPKELQDRVMKTVRDRVASTQKINSSFDHYMSVAWKDPAIKEAGMKWYQEQHNAAFEIAKQNDLNPQNVAAAMAAMSPGTQWAIEEPIIRNMASMDKENVSLSPGKLDLLNQKMDGFGLPRVSNGQPYEKMDSRSAVITMQSQFMEQGRGTWGVGYGWGGFAKGLDLMRGANVDDTLPGVKVRSFTNNIMDPSDNRDVTIDIHMVQGAARDPAVVNDSGVMSSPSYKTASIGAYPYIADVVRRVADDYGVRPNQAQALIWLGYKAEFGNAAPGESKG